MGFVKKSVLDAYNKKAAIASADGADKGADIVQQTAQLDAREGDEDWYKFDDQKVSLFPREKLGTLDGGGEDSSAYVLLYRSKSVV